MILVPTQQANYRDRLFASISLLLLVSSSFAGSPSSVYIDGKMEKKFQVEYKLCLLSLPRPLLGCAGTLHFFATLLQFYDKFYGNSFDVRELFVGMLLGKSNGEQRQDRGWFE